MENFEDPINIVLACAAAVSVAIGLLKEGFPEGLIEGVSIMIALVIIVVVNSTNNWISEQQLAKLVLLQDKAEVAVYRGSTTETVTIDTEELVVGDLLRFEQGMKIPADCVMVTAKSDLQCNETALTGESIECDKTVVTRENYTTKGLKV